MPSLADIPTRFLRVDRKIEYLNSLSKLPIDNSIKRVLINLWSRETGEPVSFDLRTRVNMGQVITSDN